MESCLKLSRLIEQLWKKKAIYEDLLLDIGPELDNKQRSAIRRALLMVSKLPSSYSLRTYRS